jgi:hypothetical protein
MYCLAHAVKTKHQLPKDVPSCAQLKKYEREQLDITASQLAIIDYKQISKAKLASNIRKKMLDGALETLPMRNANTIDLPELAGILQHKLDASLDLQRIDEVIIENQISPIAGRMKCLQAMLTQYFTMREVPSIKFVSSANKLRFTVGKKDTYSNRKKTAVEITRRYLKNTSSSYQEMFQSHAKKDDLADALLQALAYLDNIGRLHINNADYLK